LYGEEKGRRRDSVRNKIQHWRNIGFAEYKAIVEGWQILPATETNRLAVEELQNPPAFVDIPANPDEQQKPKKSLPKGDFSSYRDPYKKPSAMLGLTEVSSSSSKRKDGSGTGTKDDPCKLLSLLLLNESMISFVH
jgi:hypothetical protein